MASLAFEPVFFAVGGASKNRLQRKQLLDVCLPAAQDRSFALADSHYNADKPFRIPSWIPSVLPSLPDGFSNPPCLRSSAVKLGKRDLLLVIGHLHDEEFLALRTLHPDLPDENVWIMGGTPTAFNLKVAMGNCIDNTQCPRYNLDMWDPTLKMYPEVLQRMRGYQWGGFFATRLASLLREDNGVVLGAFYRQFNLRQIAVDKNVLAFEKDVLRGAGDKECFAKVLSQIDATVTADMDGFQLMRAIYQAYSDNGPWDDEEAMAALTQSLLSTMKKYTSGLSINEYDSYVAHLMLRHHADITEELTAAFHMRFVRYCLGVQGAHATADDPDLVEYAAQLRTGMAGRLVMVLHDLGLDPMSDDWLAVAMLMTVAATPTSSDLADEDREAKQQRTR